MTNAFSPRVSLPPSLSALHSFRGLPFLSYGRNQVGWDIRVYLPTFIYIGSHILGPFLLNPVIMRGYY